MSAAARSRTTSCCRAGSPQPPAAPRALPTSASASPVASCPSWAGWLRGRFAKKYVMLLIYLLVVSAIPLLFLKDARGTIYLFAAVFGLGLGGEYMVIPLMAGELFGVRVLGRTMGVVLTGDGIAEAVAPWVVGWMHDASGSYTNGFLALIGCALTGAIAVALLPRGVRP